MQKLIFLCLALYTYLLSGQAFAGHDSVGIENPKLFTPVCYALDEIEKVFIPPPAELISLKSAEIRSDIVVNYDSFPEAAKDAFEYAVAIWERLIGSPVPIHIHAKWKKMGTNVLAGCRPSSYEKNFKGAPLPDIYYPVALAEKLVGKEINGPGEPDIIAQFNSDLNWYFGLDGDTPTDQYDFVSVVLHELTHGLGFIGFFFSMNEKGNYGYLRMGDVTVYDVLVMRANGDRLTDPSLYQNPSVALKSALLSGDLFGNSPSATENSGSLPRLYSPPVWLNGSSVYHLDRSSYSATEENALMRPMLARGQAIHDPGPVTLGILADMGWNAKNMRRVSDDGQYAFRVEEMLEPVFAYFTDFENGADDFIMDGFSISVDDGFRSSALHSDHPYSNSINKHSDVSFVTYLKHPVILGSDVTMSFDEVVLVEPGIYGATFGSREFADYVVVEGSNNLGKTWLPLIDGYDSSDHPLWKESYNASFVKSNSVAAGREDLFVNRNIDLLGNGDFSAGDTLIIRFRLSANAEANGWGWAIDNLSIHTTVVASHAVPASASISAYPNPFRQRFKISADANEWIDHMEFDLYNAFGHKVWTERRENVSGKMDWDVDINSGMPGIYLLVVRQNGEQVYTQKMICN